MVWPISTLLDTLAPEPDICYVRAMLVRATS
jgi:hypothetical protein